MPPEKKRIKLWQIVLVGVALVGALSILNYLGRVAKYMAEDMEEGLRENLALDTKDTGSDHSPYEQPSSDPTGYPATKDGIVAAVNAWVKESETIDGITFKEYSIDPYVYDDNVCFFYIYAEGFDWCGYMDPETGDLFSDDEMTT